MTPYGAGRSAGRSVSILLLLLAGAMLFAIGMFLVFWGFGSDAVTRM